MIRTSESTKFLVSALASEPKSVLRRFFFHVRITDESECWLWMSSIDALGYGRCSYGIFGTSRPHRASYRLFKGEIPEGLDVLHSCDVRNCVNPEHLRAGTALENMADMIEQGRGNWVGSRGEANGQAKLTQPVVNAIRLLCAQGMAQAEAARRFGVSPMTVSRAVRMESWSD